MTALRVYSDAEFTYSDAEVNRPQSLIAGLLFRSGVGLGKRVQGEYAFCRGRCWFLPTGKNGLVSPTWRAARTRVNALLRGVAVPISFAGPQRAHWLDQICVRIDHEPRRFAAAEISSTV